MALIRKDLILLAFPCNELILVVVLLLTLVVTLVVILGIFLVP
jgi:hypothetical protein